QTDDKLWKAENLHRQTSGQDTSITAENVGEKMYLRCERQTLRRLPKSQDILFTIKTYLTPMSEVASDSAVAKRFATCLRNLPQSVANYKSLPVFGEAVLGYLDSMSQSEQINGTCE
ncbi:unnamed protein product, partial [Didymodactylos carnosus]